MLSRFTALYNKLIIISMIIRTPPAEVALNFAVGDMERNGEILALGRWGIERVTY